MILATSLVVVVSATTMAGLVMVSDHDVSRRHGQAVADAVALAGATSGTQAASEIASRHGARLTSMTWSVGEYGRRLIVEISDDGEVFRSDVATD